MVEADKAIEQYKKDKANDSVSDEERKQSFLKAKELLTFGDMTPSTINNQAIVFTGPGPMKISDDHDHESYFFTVENQNGSSKIKVPTEADIKKHKESRKEVLEGVKKGTTVWFTPGGQVFKVLFRANSDGSGEMIVGGRKNSAVGKGCVFEKVSLKKVDSATIAKQMERFNSRSKVRAYLEAQRGKIAQYE